jgi:hypothetical protein
MASAWTENGPISLPSRFLAHAAGATLVLLAILGVGMGFQASVRRASAPDLENAAGERGKDDALIAKPIVDLAPPVSAPDAAHNDADSGDDEDAAKADALAAQTAAAQAIQAKAAKGGGNIDDVLASPTEKPPAAVRGPADEAPPGTPVRSDVPF